MKNLIIFAEPRTGSNVLCELFHSYNNMKMLNEFFLRITDENITPHETFMTVGERECFFKYFNITDNTITGLVTFLNTNPKISLEFLNKLSQKYKVIKVHQFMFEDLDLSFLLDDTESKFILLDRTSKIKQYISIQIAEQIEQWFNVDTSKIKIHVDPDKFLKFKNNSLIWNSKMEKLLIEKNHNFLRLNYEEDLENINQALLTSKISSWLESNGISSSTNDYKLNFFKKQNLSSPEEIITNYQEIQHLI